MSETIVLVQPPPFLIRNVDYPAHLLHLGSFLEYKGYNVVIKALASLDRVKEGPVSLAQSFDSIDKVLNEYPEARTIALSSWSSFEYIITILLATYIRKMNPDIKVAVGGYHPSVMPFEFTNDFLRKNVFPLDRNVDVPDKIEEIAEIEETGQQFSLKLKIGGDSVFDIIITGEGEIALYDFLKSSTKTNNGHTQHIVQGAPISSMDDFPLNWELFEGKLDRWLENRPLIIYLSRGCPFRCKFCCTESQTKHTRMWRSYSPRKAIEVLEEVYSLFQPKIVSFGDPCFGFLRRWRIKFLEQLAQRDISRDFGFATATRIYGTSREDLRLFSRFNCMITFGVEHAEPYMLRLMNKTRRPELFINRVRKVIDDCKRYGVIAEIQMIMGFPGETEKSIMSWIQFWQELVEHFIESNGLIQMTGWPFQFVPGSDVQRNLQWYERHLGMKVLVPNWWHFISLKRYDMARMIVPSKYLPQKEYSLFFKHWQAIKNNVMTMATETIEDLEMSAKLTALYRSYQRDSESEDFSDLISYWEHRNSTKVKRKKDEISEIISKKVIAALEPEKEIDFKDLVIV